jgi:polyisoprenoid-binding protein YceI
MPIAADGATRKRTSEVAPVLAGRWQVDPEASHAGFVAGTLGGLVNVAGRFTALSGDLVVDADHAAGALAIDAASIDTGNRMRDRHLRSRAFFDVACFPQLRYEVHSISGLDPGSARIDGQLVVADTCTRMPLDVTLRTPAAGVLELACYNEVDRVALGIRGARGMVPRAVRLDVAITLRQVIA